jgi:Transposase DDE domain
MTQISHPTSALENYTQDYSDLFKDQRLFTGFQAIITGILGSGSTRIAQIAKSAPQTGTSPHSEQRLRRLIHNKNQRADLTPANISSKFTTRGAKRLAKHDEVKVILDGSDLRKPYSTSLEYLDTVLDLNGDPVAGYPTLNAIGIGQNGKQALLYHKTYSSLEDGFKSEREEIRIAIQTVTTALRAQGVGRIIWILDRGFDDRKVIDWILATGGCYVIRARHDRNITQTPDGKTKKLFETIKTKPSLGTLEMNRPVMVDGKLKRKPTQASTRAGSIWLPKPDVLVNVVALEFKRARAKNAEDQGWVLLTNLPVSNADQAQQVVALYVLRWSIEEVFAWTKTALDWEAARVLEFSAFRSLVALAWVAAAFIFELDEALEPKAFRALALLGGWVPHKTRGPGRRVLAWGLARFLDALLVEQLGYARGMQRVLFGEDMVL